MDEPDVLKEHLNDSDYHQNHDGCLFFSGDGDLYYESTNRSYAQSFADKGSIIVMTLDMEQHSISLKVNDEDYGMAYDGLKRDKYRLAVNFQTSNAQDYESEVELL